MKDTLLRCSTCKFYDHRMVYSRDQITDELLHEDDWHAECRRYPPVRGDADHFGKLGELALLHEGFSGPFVQAEAWCGEWQPAGGSVHPTAQESLMDSPLSVLPLREQMISTLAGRAGVRTIRHLTLKTEEQLTRILGKHQISELFEAMEPFNLSLRVVKSDPESDHPF